MNRDLIVKLVEKMITTDEEQSVIINNKRLDLDWWDDGKNVGVRGEYFDEDYENTLNYSSTGVFLIDDENYKEKFIDAIEFIVDFR